jgi:L-ribulokinase (putative)
MKNSSAAELIRNGRLFLGIEFGSTRIKAVLIDDACRTLAQGSHGWENRLEGGYWTYHQEEIWQGLRSAYTALRNNAEEQYGITIRHVDAIGISGMMHGYLVFDVEGNLLVPFRTWRNNTTEAAADHLTKAFSFNIPERWSAAHLYQALLSKEEHAAHVEFMTTLSGYIHWRLSGKKVLGIDDASGMFPIDPVTRTYNREMLSIFSALPASKKLRKELVEILPRVQTAGTKAGRLTREGASLLDESGNLEAGCILCPPEGDAGTGMVATNSVRKRTGNISVGTSIFSMNVLEHPLTNMYRDIDIVMTPDGHTTAMVHSNNCTSDINAWASLFSEFALAIGCDLSSDRLYQVLFEQVSNADMDAGGLMNYSFLSGENLTRTQNGRPLFVRTPKSKFTLANFMLTHLYSAFAPIRIGFDILTHDEGIEMDGMIAHGGLFRTPMIAQQVLADLLNLPISVMETASEGGAWGMAVLALYAVRGDGRDLADFLAEEMFTEKKEHILFPRAEGVQGASSFLERYLETLPVEQVASDVLRLYNAEKEC